MTKFKTKSWANAHEFKPKGETNKQPSLTVPDQTMSLRELLHRHTRGLPLHHVERPTYYNENETIDLKTLDLVDIQDLKDNIQENIEDLSNQIRAQQKPRDTSPPPTSTQTEKPLYKEQELPLKTGEADKPK